MRKVFVALAALSLLPVIAAAADKEPENQALVAASYQQGEDADPAAPVTKPMAANVPSEPSSSPAPKTEDAAGNAVENSAKAQEPNPSSKMVIFLTQQVVNLQENISDLKQQGVQISQQLNNLRYAVYGLTLLVILLALLAIVRGKKKSQTSPIAAEPAVASAQSDYDYMGSREGTPAKLDLARAYIAMEDYTAARETLTEILNEGQEDYHQEAKELLNKINK